jgi:hypothetical protein
MDWTSVLKMMGMGGDGGGEGSGDVEQLLRGLTGPAMS